MSAESKTLRDAHLCIAVIPTAVFLSGECRRAPFWRCDTVLISGWDRHSCLSFPQTVGLPCQAKDEVGRKKAEVRLILPSEFCPLPFAVTVIDKCGQATKGVWWMSWHREATKDVVACDKPREAGKRASIRGFLNEETQLHDLQLLPGECIAWVERTW